MTYFSFIELLRRAVSDPLFWMKILLLLGGVSTLACDAAACRIIHLEPMDAVRDL